MDSELDVLRRSDARYRAVLHASAAIVSIASPEGEFVERQPIWEQYTGQSWEEYRGSRWISVIHPDDREQIMADWMGAVRSGADLYRTQGRVWSAQHSAWRAFQTRGVPVRDSDGTIVEWVGALTDVQDAIDAQERLLQRERELAESRSAAERLQAQLRHVLSSNIIGVLSTRDDLVVAANDAFLAMIGRSGHDILQQPISWRGLTPPGYEAADEQALAELRSRGECRPFEKEYIRADGRHVPVLISATTVTLEPLECICIVIDITAQKQAEAALERARAAAQRASDEKTFFLAAASHDLRQPLQVLAAILPMLAGQQHDPPTARLIGRAQRAMRSLSELLNAQLDFSQLDAGLIRPVVQDFPIERLLEALREE